MGRATTDLNHLTVGSGLPMTLAFKVKVSFSMMLVSWKTSMNSGGMSLGFTAKQTQGTLQEKPEPEFTSKHFD